MKENMETDEEQISDENLLLVILVGIAGYQEENGKPFSVSKAAMQAVYDDALKDKDEVKMPVIALHHTDDERLELTVTMEALADD
jgi:low affinity Fe/Cu permease